MDNEHGVLNVLVDLDSLLDTRLPIVNMISNNVADSIINNNTYFNRHKEVFDYISNDMFKALYGIRNKEVLKEALPTLMLDTIKDYCSEAVVENLKTNGTGDVTIYLNIYPYKLNMYEYTLLEDTIFKSLGDIDVKIVNMSKSELTPKWVDSNIALMILYDGLEWLEYHTATLTIINHPLVDTALMVPTIFTGNVTTKNMSRKELIEAFSDMESMSKTLIKLTFLATKNYSAAIQK